MASLQDALSVALMAVAKMARKLQGLCPVVLRRCYVADEERAEREISLGAMQNDGVRNRRPPGPTPESNDDHPVTPTASTTSGTLTPGTSEVPSGTQDSFLKGAWDRLSNRYGAGLFSGMSAEERGRLNRKLGYDKFKQENVDKYPVGFPQLAALISCDDDLAMHRGFKYCHNRLLLQLEVQITELEKDLYKLDKEDEVDPEREHRLRWTEHEEQWDTEKMELLDKLTAKLKDYGDILRNHVFVQGLSKPPRRNHRSYFNWIWTNKPLYGGYYDYIYHASDFVSSSGGRPNYFEELIRDHMDWWPGSPIRSIVKGKKEMKPTDDPRVTVFSPTRMARLGRALLVSTIMGVLLVPVFLLFLVPMSRLLMVLTSTGFILLFVLIMSAVTEGRVYEVFVGTASYGAVLIMFLGNISQNSPGSGLH